MRLPPALQHRDYRLFWSGAFLSAAGSQFTTVAVAWQMYELTGSALQVGLLGLGRAIPQITLSLVGGLLADAVDRRRLMMAMQVLQFVVSTTLAVLTLLGLASPGLLFGASVALAFGTALETPSRQAVVPNLVPAADLTSALALNNAQRSIATIAGPSLAGIMIAIAGPLGCYVVDAVSWFAMLAALALIRTPLQTALTQGGRGAMTFSALSEGVRFVMHQPVLLAFMALDFGATFFGSSNALLPIYAKDILHVGPIGLGLLYAASSMGALVAATAMSGRTSIDRAGRWVIISVFGYGLCMIGFGVSHVFVLSMLMLAGTGAGNMVGAVLRGTSNQLLTPDALRGRVAAVNAVFVTGGPQLGQFESGLIAAVFSPELSAVTGGIGAALVVIGVALVPGVWGFDLRVVREQRARAAEGVAVS